MLKLFQNYTIGESSLELLHEVARNEIRFGIPPRISKEQKNDRDYAMEKYTCFLIQIQIDQTSNFVFMFTNSGCVNDCLFQLSDYSYYLGIQVKTTKNQTIHNGAKCWMFQHFNNPNYDGSILVLRSIEDQMMWIVPYRVLSERYSQNTTTLMIFDGPSTREFWNKYRVTINDIGLTLYRYFLMANENKYVSSKDYTVEMIPKSIDLQMELKMRQRLIGILNFEKPILDYLPYDIIWQNLKVQEKPAKFNKSNNIGLKVSCCRKNCSKYTRNDFDIILVHCNSPYDRYFYFIPADILLKRGILETGICSGKQAFYVYPYGVRKSNRGKQRDEWANEFIHEYQEPNLENKLITFCRQHNVLK